MEGITDVHPPSYKKLVYVFAGGFP